MTEILSNKSYRSGIFKFQNLNFISGPDNLMPRETKQIENFLEKKIELEFIAIISQIKF